MERAVILLQAIREPIFFFLLFFSVTVGLLALISPRYFKTISKKCSSWFNTPMRLPMIDTTIDTDHFFFSHSRITGASIIALSVVLAFAHGIL